MVGDGADRNKGRLLVRRTIMSAVAVAAAFVAVVANSPPAGALPPPLVFLDEPFTGAQVQIPSQWIRPGLPAGQAGSNVACLTASANTSETPIPGCQSPAIDTAPNGTLRLTSAAVNLDGGASYAGTVPSSQGLDIRFNTYQYSGTGADGILFYLTGSDPMHPAPPSTLGPPGGHLGYSGGSAAPTGNGLADGYLGIGLDAYGNYSNSSFDGTGCTNPTWVGSGARVPNQVTVRGPGSGTVGYCPLGSTAAGGGLSGSLRGASGSTRATTLVPVEIAINPTAAVITTSGIPSIPAYSYVVAISPLGGPTQYVTGGLPNAAAFEPSAWLEPATGIPYQLAMGFAASTGGSTDVHEVRNISVQPLFGNPAQTTLQLSDSAAGALVQGTPVVYTAKGALTSAGGSLNQSTSLVATLPTGVVPGTASGTNWSCTTTGQTVTCGYTGTIPIPAGTVLPAVTIPANVTPGSSGPATATAQFVSDDAQIASASDPGVINATAAGNPLLGVALADNVSGSFTQGGSATYSAQGVVSSGGTAESNVVTLTDTLPSGIVPGTALGTNWSCGTAAQTVTCTYAGTLPVPAGTVLPVVSIPVTVSATVSGGIADTVSVSSSDAATAQATDYGSVTSVPAYGLTLTDSVGGNIPALGSFTYTATPSLVATSGAESLDPTYSQAMATGVTASAASGTGWTCTLLSAKTVVSCLFSGTIPSPGGSFPSITISAKTSLSSGNVSSTGTVSSPDGVAATTTDAANVASPPPPGLSVVTSGPSQVYAGSAFTLVVSPSIAYGSANHDPVLTSVLPAGETFALSSTTQAGYNCALSTTTVANDTLTCTATAATPIGVGALPTIDGTVNVAGAATGSPATTTKMTDAGDNATPAASASAPSIVPVPQLALALVAPSQAYVGTSVQIGVNPSVSGSGGPALSAPTVTLTAPAGATFPAAPTPVGYSCSLTSSTVISCPYTGSLPLVSGASLPSITASSVVGSLGPLQFTGSNTDAADGATAGNGTATVTVTAVPTLVVTSSGTPASAPYGSTYSLGVQPSTDAAGGPAYNDPSFTATLPAGEVFAALGGNPAGYTCGLSAGNTVLTCTSTAATPIGPGTALGSASFTVDVNVASGTLTTDITLSDSADGAVPATTSATVVATQAAQTISFTPPASGSVGGGATLSATGGASGNPVTFTVDPGSSAGACTVTGTTVSYTGVGNCIIDADQAGNANYSAAPQVTGTVVVGKGAQAITFTPPASWLGGRWRHPVGHRWRVRQPGHLHGRPGLLGRCLHRHGNDASPTPGSGTASSTPTRPATPTTPPPPR